MEVLELISFGKTRIQIADSIYLSPNTISSYIKNLYIKLNVRNKAHLVTKGFELGLLQIEENYS